MVTLQVHFSSYHQLSESHAFLCFLFCSTLSYIRTQNNHCRNKLQVFFCCCFFFFRFDKWAWSRFSLVLSCSRTISTRRTAEKCDGNSSTAHEVDSATFPLHSGHSSTRFEASKYGNQSNTVKTN